MKTLITIIVCIGLSGCGANENTYETSDGDEVWITVIDGCEYIGFHTYASHGYTHKGNCSNPIHQCP